MIEPAFSQACENNKNFILEVLRRHLGDGEQVLEIAGGTGQHGVHFAEQMPGINWQSSDIPSNVATLNSRIEAATLPNLPSVFALDVNDLPWNCVKPSTIFSANSLHIMGADSVENFFVGTGVNLQSGGKLIVYGPFKYGGEFTTPSNEDFDAWLKERDKLSGVRDFEWVDELAAKAGLSLVEDNPMPANNQCLVWTKSS